MAGNRRIPELVFPLKRNLTFCERLNAEDDPLIMGVSPDHSKNIKADSSKNNGLNIHNEETEKTIVSSLSTIQQNETSSKLLEVPSFHNKSNFYEEKKFKRLTPRERWQKAIRKVIAIMRLNKTLKYEQKMFGRSGQKTSLINLFDDEPTTRERKVYIYCFHISLATYSP